MYIKLRNRSIYRRVKKYVKSGNFLDIGFGDDNLIRYFYENFKVFGVDISKYAVQKIREKYPDNHFKINNIDKQDLPFGEKFDVITLINTLEHLNSPEMALKRIWESLKDEGILLTYLPTYSNRLSEIQYKKFYDVREHVFRPSVEDIEKLMQDVGYKKECEYCANFLPISVKVKMIIESFNLYMGIWRKV